MSTRRFVAFVILITVGFGALPLEGGVRTAGKIALALAAALFALRPESRRRMAGAAASAAGAEKRFARPVFVGMAIVTVAMIALVVFDSARIGEILTLGDALLRYAEVDAYLWVVSLALAGRSWRIELARTRAQSNCVAPGGAASSAARTRKS